MSLGLDLSNSEAKIARANEHLASLYAEVASILKERPPYTTIPVLNQESSCYVIMLRSSDFKETRLGVILGDFIHNLRSALDYITTALVKASPGVELSRKHQFPIFATEQSYTETGLRMLTGIIHGRDLVESLQPFQRKPNPTLDPLFCINHFSNSDKHRVISDYWPVLGPISGSKISPKEGITGWQQFPPPMQWFPNDERGVFLVSYTPPAPLQVNFYCEISVDIRFGAARLGKGQKQLAFPLFSFDEASHHVAMIVNTFKLL
jgi:hypothetical protein